IEDILRERQYTSYHILSILLDACVDELEVLVADEFGEWNVMQRIRRRIEELFGPQESISRKIQLDRFVRDQLETLRPRFAHRQCQLVTQLAPTAPISIPPDVLAKIIEGLIRNAVENTPDGGKIEVAVRQGEEVPEFEVKDYGIGMTEENQRLIFENYFPSYETLQYASRKPYDFKAGGKGFDLLRMKIFSERYHFKLRMSSRRCGYLSHDKDLCPGKTGQCAYCQTDQDCIHSGGTTMLVQFASVEQIASITDTTQPTPS
ncbi:histidine kinase, partial [candidate division KSB3 bacterium]|nr:histidine kinase [candidate division KSB3 bacterium]MBD3327184.1 histidine kinase [candidate division KSB3 bacterium]